MSDENKQNALDDGDDLLSDFNDLFPEESDDEPNKLVVDDSNSSDDLDSLLEDLDAPASGQDDEADIDSLLDTLDDGQTGAVVADKPAEETGGAAELLADDEDLDLDSLLDGLEEHVDEILESDEDKSEEGADLDTMLDDMIAETAPARDLDIEQDELDLSAVSDVEDEPGAEAPEESTEDEDEDNFLDNLISEEEEPFAEEEPEIVPVAAAAVATAAATTQTPAQQQAAIADESPETQETVKSSDPKVSQRGKSSSWIGVVILYTLLIIALAAAGGATWLVLQTQQSADINRAQISKLQKQYERSSTPAGSLYNPLVEQNSSAIRDLDQRINELSTMMDGPLSHINSNNQEMQNRYEERLQQLEQRFSNLKQETEEQIATLRGELAKKPVSVAASAPLLVKPAASSPKTEKLWALNLLSLSSRKGATDEVKRLQDAGINASRDRFTAKDGKAWYRVRVTGFSSYEEAKAYASQLPKITGIDQSWVTPE